MNFSGLYSFYKPVGPSSAKFLNEIKRLLPKGTRIGHAGTLDPLASGVLVVAIGREFTKKISEAVEAEKEYIAKIKLGYKSATDDEEGEKIMISSLAASPSRKEVEKATDKFVGNIMQVPPAYSAIKVGGRRSYEVARKGGSIELKARPVEIKGIEILEYEYPFLIIKVVTGKGVYIRSLARDIGRELGVGGYLAGLERTRVGGFKKEGAMSVEEFEQELGKTHLSSGSTPGR